MAKKVKKERNLLDLIPEKLCESEVNEEGKVIILAPRFKSKLGRKIFEPVVKNKYVRIHLDEVGTFVWNEIDGQKNVFELSKMLKNEFGEKVEPVYERIGKFIAIMKVNGFIRLKEKGD
ncbi:conserved hypothetical protein [Thermotomaculum hydrothermale]|uniref:PqqD family protein n=1 Tax=Thermotomaculum hydrothermale TaxID=981385 RepID=A0A7R6T0E0_9BACT|nr:PqqD family protein [Thermotomaculum hydrothermale]BBB33602.1 conserved hypothetical protein [Thermotomaculum hydrothermale]